MILWRAPGPLVRNTGASPLVALLHQSATGRAASVDSVSDASSTVIEWQNDGHVSCCSLRMLNPERAARAPFSRLGSPRLGSAIPLLTVRNPHGRLVERRGGFPAGSLCTASKLRCRSNKRKIRRGVEETRFRPRKGASDSGPVEVLRTAHKTRQM